MGKVATSPLPPRGSPPPQSGGQNQKWPTNGQGGYVTPAASGIPSASERGAKSEVAHKWARWLRHPCRLGDRHRLRAGGGNQKWPINGQGGYVTPAALGIPTASERGAKSEVAHKWARWLHHPCRLGDPLRLRAGLVGWLVGWLLPRCPGARPGPPRLQATGGRGCVTRCMSHVPRALGLARAALARSRSAPSPVSGTSGSTASRAVPCPPAPMLCVVAPVSLLPPPRPVGGVSVVRPMVSCRCSPAGAPRRVPCVAAPGFSPWSRNASGLRAWLGSHPLLGPGARSAIPAGLVGTG